MKLPGQRLAACDFGRQIDEFPIRVAVMIGFTSLSIPGTKVVIGYRVPGGKLRTVKTARPGSSSGLRSATGSATPERRLIRHRQLLPISLWRGGRVPAPAAITWSGPPGKIWRRRSRERSVPWGPDPWSHPPACRERMASCCKRRRLSSNGCRARVPLTDSRPRRARAPRYSNVPATPHWQKSLIFRYHVALPKRCLAIAEVCGESLLPRHGARNSFSSARAAAEA